MSHARLLSQSQWGTIMLLLSSCVVAASEDSFLDGFKTPPRKFSMVPLWSWNGRLEPDELRWQIDQMVDKGVYGAFMHARAGINQDTTPYFSDGWWQAVEACVEHGKKVGFDTWIYDEDKWPSGAAGGRTIRRNPLRNRQKILHREELRVRGTQNVKIAFQGARYIIAGRLVDGKRIAQDSLQDLTHLNNVDSLWPCPEGDWMVYRYVFEDREGVNYLNKETVRDFIDITHEEYARRFGEHLGETIPGVFFDEIQNEAGKDSQSTVWVEGFEERFWEMKGYDLPPLLPALVTDIGSLTPKIRCDYYDVYTTIYEEAWFRQLADWCDTHGIELTGHTIEELNRYTTQGNYTRTIRHLQIPTTDNEDFRYTWPRTIDPWKPKQLASISHLYGHPRSGVEAMGGAGWCFNLNMGRYGFNMLSAYGINFFISHLFHYAQDRPSNVDDWPNSWFFRNPYWKYFKTFADHGSRLSYMLTGGKHVVDVAVLNPQTNCWAGYGSGSTQDTIARLVATQIDVDLIDPESLMRAEVSGASLLAGEMRYRILIVPGVQCIRLAEARRLVAFIKAGGRVIIHERWPTDSMENGKNDLGLIEFRRDAELHGIRLSAPDETVQQINEILSPDVIVLGGNENPLRYHHISRDGREIYWLVNSGRALGTWNLSFRTVGRPAIWQPEDGSITPLTAFVRQKDRTECSLTLGGWQGCFAVFDQEDRPLEGGIRITASNLRGNEVLAMSEDKVTVSGLQPTQEARAEVEADIYSNHEPVHVSLTRETGPGPEPIALNETWQFLPVGGQLDHQWRVDVNSVELNLPVMGMKWERETGEPARGWHLPAFDDSRWRRVRILDRLHAEDGAERYRSRWDARFISHFHYTPFDLEFFFQPEIGGEGLRVKRTYVLPPEMTQARLAVLSDSPFRVFVNGKEKAKGMGGNNPECVDLQGLRPGECTLGIEAANSRAILAEGEFLNPHGAPIRIYSDQTWSVSLDGRQWMQSWEYVAPPEHPYGEPPHPWVTVQPHVVWYRISLPPGAVAMCKPNIEGDWQAWTDGMPLAFRHGESSLPSRAGLLAVRVAISENEHGLMEPIRVRCVMSESPLGSWTEHKLDWYSGRAIYSTEFLLEDEYREDDMRLELDLGKVCYCAEIWLNDQLVGTRIWPPYRLDITTHTRPGRNTLHIVVANLLANRMQWDIFDDVKSALGSRKWHDSHIRRDAWCLESGLLGPVRIMPYREVTLSHTITK